MVKKHLVQLQDFYLEFGSFLSFLHSTTTKKTCFELNGSTMMAFLSAPSRNTHVNKAVRSGYWEPPGTRTSSTTLPFFLTQRGTVNGTGWYRSCPNTLNSGDEADERYRATWRGGHRRPTVPGPPAHARGSTKPRRPWTPPPELSPAHASFRWPYRSTDELRNEGAPPLGRGQARPWRRARGACWPRA